LLDNKPLGDGDGGVTIRTFNAQTSGNVIDKQILTASLAFEENVGHRLESPAHGGFCQCLMG
jgi:hypothetical protein